MSWVVPLPRQGPAVWGPGSGLLPAEMQRGDMGLGVSCQRACEFMYERLRLMRTAELSTLITCTSFFTGDQSPPWRVRPLTTPSAQAEVLVPRPLLSLRFPNCIQGHITCQGRSPNVYKQSWYQHHMSSAWSVCWNKMVAFGTRTLTEKTTPEKVCTVSTLGALFGLNTQMVKTRGKSLGERGWWDFTIKLFLYQGTLLLKSYLVTYNSVNNKINNDKKLHHYQKCLTTESLISELLPIPGKKLISLNFIGYLIYLIVFWATWLL